MALRVAEAGLFRGELPIAAVIVVDDEIIAEAHTQERSQGRLLVHAELLALDVADRVLGSRRREAALYTTLEPCLGCLGAAMTAKVGTIVYGLSAPSDGAAEFARRWDREGRVDEFPGYYLPAIRGGVLRDQCADLFAQYVAASALGNPLAVWAHSLIK